MQSKHQETLLKNLTFHLEHELPLFFSFAPDHFIGFFFHFQKGFIGTIKTAQNIEYNPLPLPRLTVPLSLKSYTKP